MLVKDTENTTLGFPMKAKGHLLSRKEIGKISVNALRIEELLFPKYLVVVSKYSVIVGSWYSQQSGPGWKENQALPYRTYMTQKGELKRFCCICVWPLAWTGNVFRGNERGRSEEDKKLPGDL